MATDRDLEDLANLYGKARDATQELAFSIAKMPFHFRDCRDDVKRGKAVSVQNIEYQGTLLKARASAALKAIGALHAHAAATFPDQSQIQEEEAA